MLRTPTLKRLFDVSCAGALLLVLSPILFGLAVAVAVASGRPVLFRQRRPGLNGRPFTLVKFRTMRDATDARGVPLSDAERLTRFGAWLRATSLDELPELWNVVRGDMSLVGPRPLLMEYLPRYTNDQWRRHLVRPGITGWAQVHGRNALSWEERFARDVWYVEHWTLALDLRILFDTITRVLSREGISQPGHVTAAPFTGTPATTLVQQGGAACSPS
jgi:lipopolysaccharide/colanic/teichoic acid biosynthesis glycosyltransferase